MPRSRSTQPVAFELCALFGEVVRVVIDRVWLADAAKEFRRLRQRMRFAAPNAADATMAMMIADTITERHSHPPRRSTRCAARRIRPVRARGDGLRLAMRGPPRRRDASPRHDYAPPASAMIESIDTPIATTVSAPVPGTHGPHRFDPLRNEHERRDPQQRGRRSLDHARQQEKADDHVRCHDGNR